MSHFAAMKSPLPVTAAGGDAKIPLFCPKPRRPVAPIRCHGHHQSGGYSSDVDLLDLLLLSKGEESGVPAPPFCGSPPRRASNPVVRDSRFGTVCPPLPPLRVAAVPAADVPRPAPRQPSSAPSMSPRGGGCARARFAFQPAAVRVEGFDCLDGGRHGHGITAMA